MLFRVCVAVACILLGFAFFPMFLLGAVIALSIFQDIRGAPEQRAREARLDELARAPVSAQDLRDACESPAEVAFLDAMIDAYGLKSGEGALEGNGLRLTSQKGLGAFRIHSHGASHQYRADFIVDGKLVVEIDGAAYHSTPQAIARDRKRDADLAREGYRTLRIPAREVFQTPSKAIAAVEKARTALRKGGPAQAEPTAAASNFRAKAERHRPLISRIADTLEDIDNLSEKYYAIAVIEKAVGAIFSDIEIIVENASAGAAREAPPTTASEGERREANRVWLRRIVEAVNAEPRDQSEKQAACSKAVDIISRGGAQEYCERAIENAVDAHMSKLEAAHKTLFPELDAFPDNWLTGVSQRDVLIEGLRAVFFEGADPTKFHHPYVPPAKGKAIFTSWWEQQVAGLNPISRSSRELIDIIEASASK